MSVLTRATQILNVLAETGCGLSVRELAEATGLPKSTVHRVLQELAACQYVVSNGRVDGYRLGPGVLKLGLNSRRQFVAPMRRALIALARAVNENVDLAILSGGEMLIIEQITATNAIPTMTVVGRTFALHASSIGKALLSQIPPAQARQLLGDNLEAFTPNTITDIDAVLRELIEVRNTGIAFDREEHDLGICAVAIALPHPEGIPQAITIVAPTQRFVRREAAYVAALRALSGHTDPV
ncbi:IclR family transcriptional regulator [Mycolicibacterium boenickei]|uniref:IclR family transcriptional regulator n=1 Tax=Mycolicibacterium boenickei TaxID=146017 RepID=A0AAX3A040_9MYCO|nr:IclR family transcriptional regulator [Mycolicibacterium boenickei]PEG59058.1 IclR family transcriptional regulator [Mycolicibacterium boenickei]UNC00905.1 IclR family transcriptional regulator [Mycolicibacterium boenickei]BBX90710.1 putative transcriptional regulator, IclR family protein [Mycolicibacterium boenickei]